MKPQTYQEFHEFVRVWAEMFGIEVYTLTTPNDGSAQEGDRMVTSKGVESEPI